MISSVNSVSFKAATPYDPISRPGKYTVMPKETTPDEKKHKAAKWILGLATTAVAIGALLVVGKNKNWFKVIDNAKTLKNAEFMDKCKHYLGKAANAVDEKCWQPLKEVPSKISKWWAERGAKPEVPAPETVA